MYAVLNRVALAIPLAIVCLYISDCQAIDDVFARGAAKRIANSPEDGLNNGVSNVISGSAPNTLAIHPGVRPIVSIQAATICHHRKLHGRMLKCCRHCKQCRVEKSKCVNGKGSCRCSNNGCKYQYKAYAKHVKALKKKKCHKKVRKCKKVHVTSKKWCKKCYVHDRRYKCGKKCKKVVHYKPGPYKNKKVDCIIPGKSKTITYITKTCSSPPTGTKCKYISVPNKVKCGKVHYRHCASISISKRVCVGAKIPTKKCITLLQPKGQKCTTIHGGKVSCKKVHDGYTKHCYLFSKPKHHCTTTYKKQKFNCRKVKMTKRGSCTKKYELKKVCSRGLPAKKKCKDVIKTKLKCFLVLSYKKVCPTKKQKVCKKLPQRVKIPGSCKKTKLPCLSFAVRNVASRASKPAFEAYKECSKTGIVCKYKTVYTKSCMMKDVAIKGRRCAEIPRYVKKCKPIKTKARVCYRLSATVAATPVSGEKIPMTSYKGPGSGKCAQTGHRCSGAPGRPFFKYIPCCRKNERCVPHKSKGWGKFCIAKGPKNTPPDGLTIPLKPALKMDRGAEGLLVIHSLSIRRAATKPMLAKRMPRRGGENSVSRRRYTREAIFPASMLRCQ